MSTLLREIHLDIEETLDKWAPNLPATTSLDGPNWIIFIVNKNAIPAPAPSSKKKVAK